MAARLFHCPIAGVRLKNACAAARHPAKRHRPSENPVSDFQTACMSVTKPKKASALLPDQIRCVVQRQRSRSLLPQRGRLKTQKRHFGHAESVCSEGFFPLLKPLAQTSRSDIRSRVRRCATHPAERHRPSENPKTV
ncbi:hypothetical protein [Kingella potus]|uniref:hypothetical protein n=1 Tax=Kingella potus TaxID=265175 RepID=UPI001FCF95FE|nr:hypothetical protein [Kingella potus]UOP00873.1 hypothetical protein LVJ84_00025 [Kingella potus]